MEWTVHHTLATGLAIAGAFFLRKAWVALEADNPTGVALSTLSLILIGATAMSMMLSKR